ncbi:MAG: hypothetical protein AAF674_06645 [Pseudomonadota bacterium]
MQPSTRWTRPGGWRNVSSDVGPPLTGTGMRLLIDVLHPAHVHFFRHFIEEMTARGHQCWILSREKDVATDLLDAFNLPHQVISQQRPGLWMLARELLQRVSSTRRAIQEFQPDLILGLMGPSIALAGRLTRRRTIVFYDNETTHRLNWIVCRLVDAWISPRAYRHDYGSKHLRYAGYHELAYLHPARFTVDPSRLTAHGLDPAKPFSLLRFVAWESIHDGGETGLGLSGKRRAIELLGRMGDVYISSEHPLPAAFEAYRLNLPVEQIHHALAAATVVVGESSTMASEAACLGTHAVFVSKSGRGVNDEQQARYGLVRNFNGGSVPDALGYLEGLVTRNPDAIKAEAQAQRDHMLTEVVDVTAYLIDYVENLAPE